MRLILKVATVLCKCFAVFFVSAGVFLVWLTLWPPQDIYLGLKLAAGFVIAFRLAIISGVLAVLATGTHFSFSQFGGKKKERSLAEDDLPYGVP
jgi:hypothetical protein